MTSKPEVSVYISVAHLSGGVTTIAHVRAYAVDITDNITPQDVTLVADLAARRFGLTFVDQLGDMEEKYRVMGSVDPGTL